MSTKCHTLFIRLFLVLTLLLAGTGPSSAFEVMTGPIEKFMDEQGNGPFGDLARQLGKEMGEETKITVLPWKRLHKVWHGGQGDTMFPIMHWTSAEKGYLNTEPFYYKMMVAFVAKSNPVPTTFSDLKGLQAAGILGFTAPPEARQAIDNAPQKVKDETAALRMVASGRADYTIIELQTGLSAISRLGFEDKLNWNPDKPVWVEKVGFEVRNDDKGRQLKKRIDKAMQSLIRNGKLPWLAGQATQ